MAKLLWGAAQIWKRAENSQMPELAQLRTTYMSSEDVILHCEA
jgi:hypothetical protein